MIVVSLLISLWPNSILARIWYESFVSIIIFSDLYDDGYFGDVESGAIDYFGRLDRTLFTCLMLSTLEKVEPITR